jgi:2-dehydropantoate 2-reductase
VTVSVAKRILVVGCGSIGGIVASSLYQHYGPNKPHITVLSRNESTAMAVQERGFVVDRPNGKQTIPGEVHTALPKGTAPFDWILLATQPQQVEAATLQVHKLLDKEGYFVCFQNGLCEERIAAVAGHQRVIGAIVSWGASVGEPGEFIQTSAGGFAIGCLNPEHRPALDELEGLLQIVGPVVLTENLKGSRWSKLAISCAISTLGTLGGDRLGALLRYRIVRRLGLEMMTELVQVAQAEQIMLKPLAGTFDLEWLALTEEERRASFSPSLLAKHGVLIAVGTRHRRLRSSMLRAIERGRKPAVDFLNGEVVTRGEAYGIPTPVNTLATQWVHEIAAGSRKSSVQTLQSLYQHTR